MNNFLKRGSLLLVLCLSISTFGQSRWMSTLQAYLNENHTELGVTAEDVQSFGITDEVPTKKTGVWHVHIVQQVNGLDVINGVANITIDPNGDVIAVGNRLIAHLNDKLSGSGSASIAPLGAIAKAKERLALSGQMGTALTPDATGALRFEGGTLSQEDVTARLVYWNTGEEVRLAWVIGIYQMDGEHWWQLILDAQDGQELHRYDWVVRCTFPNHPEEAHVHSHENMSEPAALAPATPAAAPASNGAVYNVYPLPIESPSHGVRALLTNPHDTAASPWGWHDTNGMAGAEYTITRGNNVHAYTDTTDNNQPDFEPDGGTALNFDFTLDLNQAPGAYKSAATTNLFYMNNRIHDVMWHYGLDEAGGAFQETNYTGVGGASDEVRAEAQDGGGLNNANFATPPDGSSGRMQMYLWTGQSSGDIVTIHTPASIVGTYPAGLASFGPAITTTPVTGDLALAYDGVADSLDVCDSIINPTDLSGKIAVVRRGNCSFTSKVLACQNAGAIGVIVVNNLGAAAGMGGSSASVTIPSVMVASWDGQDMIDALVQGDSVNASLSLPLGFGQDRDGDLDNGIIIHEYAHGISNRMTGGPSASGCLGNEEQMGEGWSDFYGIMMTMDTAFGVNPARRPMGTYAVFESPTSGGGIRPVPYDTNFATNNYTYADRANANISIPHGVGFIWCTMLWDLNWAFIDQYGYDPDLIGGTGGNAMVFRLVTDALTLQPCGPGFVDGRDAILLADQLAYSGANECLIWEVFARRGLGASADQGSPNSRSDGSAAFDVPLSCQVATEAPTADFEVAVDTTCDGTFDFIDLSFNVPQNWSWDFGDGTTDTIQSPSHTYSATGSYTVKLTVSNDLGVDSLIRTNYVHYIAPTDNPAVAGGSGCSADSIQLTAFGNATPLWYDNSLQLVGSGNVFMASPSTTTQDYFVRDAIVYPTEFIGPADNSIGGGGYHATTYTGHVNLDASVPLTIKSAWVDADGPGIRVVNVYDSPDATGNIIQTVQVNISQGGVQRVDLNIDIPSPGLYSFGLDQAGLYRNNTGPSYPYDVAGLMTINAPEAGSDFYYYFYDLEVTRTGCEGALVQVTATVIDIIDFSYAVNNQTVQFTDASPNATSWAWDFGDGNSSNQQNPSHTYGADGIYTVTLTTDGGTCVKTEQVVIGVVTLEEQDVLSAEVFPNPAVASVTIQLAEPLVNEAELSIYSIDGREWFRTTLERGTSEEELDVRTLANGVYWIRVESNGQELREKLVIQK